MKYPLAIILIFAAAGNASAAFDCMAAYQKLRRAFGNYSKEVRDSYGLRIFLKNRTKLDDLADDRLLLFWARRPQGELPWLEKSARSLANHPASAAALATPRYKFDMFGAVDHLIQKPFNATSQILADKGLIKNPKSLTIPAMMALSWPVWSEIDAGLKATRDMENEDRERHLLEDDYRFTKVAEAVSEEKAAYEEAAKAGQANAEIKKRHAKFKEDATAAIKDLEAQHHAYEATARKYMALYQQSKGDTAALDFARVKELLQQPLFQDIAKLARVKDPKVLDPAQANFKIAEELVTQRERLFYRYHLIPTAMDPGSGLSQYDDDTIRSIRSSPVYKALKPAYQSGALSAGAFQRALMEDSFWSEEKFPFWKAMHHLPPARLDENGSPSQERLRLIDVEKELIADTLPKKNAASQ